MTPASKWMAMPSIRVFDEVECSKGQALKVLEEAAEVLEAWKEYKYQQKADYYWECYQMDGQSSALRAHERNDEMADALTKAINAAPISDELAELKWLVLDLDPDDERGDLVTAVKRLQKRVREGKVLPW